MEMNRKQFMELMGFKEGDDGLDYADEMHEEGMSLWEIAKETITTMNMLIQK